MLKSKFLYSSLFSASSFPLVFFFLISLIKCLGFEDKSFHLLLVLFGMEEQMRMAQHCTYASNPYHVCSKFCSQRAARSKDSAVDESLAPKDVRGEENGENAEVRRNVNPLCGYASNPYHKCTDFCTRRNPNHKSSPKGASFILPFMSSERRKERVMTVNANNVNPSCSYASNPYHQCTKHCSQRTKKMIEIEQGKPGIAAIVSTERISRGIGKTQRNNVDPRCKYASNPYHKCSSFCSLKINKVA